MSEREVEIVRDSIEAFNRRDLEAMLAATDPDVLIEDIPDLPEAKPFRGHEGMREFLALNWEPWEFVRTEIERLIDHGDDVIVLNRNRARGRGSRIDVDQTRGAIFTVRNEKIVRVRFYTEPQQALEAAGLTAEQELS